MASVPLPQVCSYLQGREIENSLRRCHFLQAAVGDILISPMAVAESVKKKVDSCSIRLPVNQRHNDKDVWHSLLPYKG